VRRLAVDESRDAVAQRAQRHVDLGRLVKVRVKVRVRVRVGVGVGVRVRVRVRETC